MHDYVEKRQCVKLPSNMGRPGGRRPSEGGSLMTRMDLGNRIILFYYLGGPSKRPWRGSSDGPLNSQMEPLDGSLVVPIYVCLP